MEELADKVRDLLQRAEIRMAFKELDKEEEKLSSTQRDTLIQLQNRFRSLQSKQVSGLLSFGEARVEEANILNGLLLFLNDLEDSAASEPVSEASSPSRNSTDRSSSAPAGTTKILFLAANPTDTGRLRLSQEQRDISEGLKRADKRDQFEMVTRMAVRPRDLTLAMMEVSPSIVHFSGHGVQLDADAPTTPETQFMDWGQDMEPAYLGGIALENDQGKAHIVRAEALGALFDLFSEQVDCVVLNACYSHLQAEALKPHVCYIIGMNTAVPDETAVAFATAFYDALGAGKDIPFAFKLARTALQLGNLPGADIPVLIEGKCGR